MIKSDKTLQSLIAAFNEGDKKSLTISDGRGLGLHLSKTRSPYWRLRLFANNKERVTSLGIYPKIGLAEARHKAEEIRVQYRQTGLAPVDILTAATQSRAAQLRKTFSEVARRWFDATSTQLTSKHRSQIINTLEQHAFPVLGAMQIDAISPGLIIDNVLQPMLNDGRIETAMRLYQRISAVCEWACLHHLATKNAAALLKREFTRRKKQAEKLNPSKNFPAITDKQQFAELIRRIRKYQGIRTRIALQLLAHIACRPTELRIAHRHEFDLSSKIWTIPRERMKTREGNHVIPLTRQTIALLEEIFQYATRDGKLFWGDSGDYISESTMNNALHTMGYKNIHASHGFRSSFSTLGREFGYPREAIEAQLAHKIGNEIESAYMRSTFLEMRREIMQRWSNWVESIG